MFDMEGAVGADIVSNFMSDTDLLTQAAQALQDAGFQVLQSLGLHDQYRSADRNLRTRLQDQGGPGVVADDQSQGIIDTATFFTVADTPRFGLITTAGTAFENLIEGVALESAAVLHGGVRCRAAQVVLAPATFPTTSLWAAMPTRRIVAASPAAASRWRWSTRPLAHPFFAGAAIASSRSRLGPARPTRWLTRAAMARPSRPISLPCAPDMRVAAGQD